MRFVCIVKHQDGSGDPWKENYDKPQCADIASARRWSENTISLFNASLRPGEKPRQLLDVIPSEEKGSSAHSWEKISLVTQVDRHGVYDAMRCRICRITGKRHGLSQDVTIDPAYKAKGFLHCSRAVELMKKRKERAA